MRNADSPAIHAVNVRTLAEFSLLTGDLSFEHNASECMRDGAKNHRRIQNAFSGDWKAEEWVQRDVELEGVSLRAQGRADGVSRKDGLRVLEIKTTHCYPAGIRENDHPEHLAQAQLYAYLLAENEDFPSAEVTLLYCRDDGLEKRFVHSYTRKQLQALFLRYAVPYAQWLRGQDTWHMLSIQSAQNLKFPYGQFRQGQRDMAQEVYRTACRGGKALIEAPTGIGKTAAALFGAVKALGRHRGTIFYLTARATGKLAAEHALAKMRDSGLRLRSVTLTAKEKCCPEQGMICYGCPYSVGYYDRLRDALKDARETEAFRRETIADFAEKYRLCPFEFSLDLAEISDVIICDYNYVFDPNVQLKRFFDGNTDSVLLIDEAHNLPTRAQDMYSCELSPKEIENVCNEMLLEEGQDGAYRRAARKLLLALQTEQDEPSYESKGDIALAKACEVFSAEVEEVGKTRNAALLTFTAQRFAKMSYEFDEQCYRVLYFPEKDGLRVKIWCFDPTPYLRRTFAQVGGAVMFSATLSPMYYYARQLSVDTHSGDRALMLPSPFPEENLLVLRLNLPTTLRERSRTLEAVARAFYALGEHIGNYLACFPSYAYLDMAYRQFRLLYPDAHVLRQNFGMDEAQKQRFLDAFVPHPKQSMYAMIAMGGIFSEGIDLPGDRLSGAAIVGSGVPQIDMENELLRELSDDADEGYDFAYVYPGIRRVLQAAGRVIRTESDKGVILLIDQRFFTEKYAELLPSHWRVEDAKNLGMMKKRMEKFWHT